jgi:hypothetical protein
MKPILFASLLFISAAQGAELQCPDRYPAKDLELTAPQGWTGHVGGGARLIGAGALVGKPEDNGELRGQDRKTRDGYEIRYAGLNDYLEPLQKWVFCSYGHGGEIRLFRRMPDDTGKCTVKYRRNKEPAIPTVGITCSAASR